METVVVYKSGEDAYEIAQYLNGLIGNRVSGYESLYAEEVISVSCQLEGRIYHVFAVVRVRYEGEPIKELGW